VDEEGFSEKVVMDGLKTDGIKSPVAIVRSQTDLANSSRHRNLDIGFFGTGQVGFCSTASTCPGDTDKRI